MHFTTLPRMRSSLPVLATLLALLAACSGERDAPVLPEIGSTPVFEVVASTTSTSTSLSPTTYVGIAPSTSDWREPTTTAIIFEAVPSSATNAPQRRPSRVTSPPTEPVVESTPPPVPLPEPEPVTEPAEPPAPPATPNEPETPATPATPPGAPPQVDRGGQRTPRTPATPALPDQDDQ